MSNPNDITAILAKLFEQGVNATPQDIAEWVNGGSSDYTPVKHTADQLLAVVLDCLPSGDKENWLKLEDRPTDYIIGFEDCKEQTVANLKALFSGKERE